MNTTTLSLTSEELTAITAVLTAYAMGLIGKETTLTHVVSPERAEAVVKAITSQYGLITQS